MRQPDDDAVITITVPTDEGVELLMRSPHLVQIALQMESWIGEFGAPDVGTAFVAAYCRLIAKRRGLIPQSAFDQP